MISLLVAISRALAAGSLPAIEGELSGELNVFSEVPSFILPWKIKLGPASEKGQEFSLVVDAVGTRLTTEGRLNLATGDGSWKIKEARFDVGAWFAACAPKIASKLAGVVAQGTVTITGEGTLKKGQPTGHIRIDWHGGGLRQQSEEWALDRIAFQGEFAIDAISKSFHSTSPLELKIGLVTSSRFGARNLSISALVNEQHGLSLTAARVEIAGGEVTVEPCEVPVSPLEVDANLHINRVGLQDIVFLLPTAGLDEAHGRIDGVVQVKWTGETGFQLGLGRMEVRADEPTIVRLSAAPGILTGHVPHYIDLLPSWMGPLARWIRPENPAYKNMRSIELGQSELKVETLKVQLTPEGDGQRRSAVVRLVAQPMETGSTVKEVAFDVNVRGPIVAVVKLGLERGFTMDIHK